MAKWRKTRRGRCCKYCGRFVSKLDHSVSDDWRFCSADHRHRWVRETMQSVERVAVDTVSRLQRWAEICRPWFAVAGELTDRERLVCFVGWLYRRKHPYLQAVRDGLIEIENRGDYLNWLFAIGQYKLSMIAGKAIQGLSFTVEDIPSAESFKQEESLHV